MEIPRDEVQKRNDAKKNLYYLFHQKVDKVVIDMVLAQCKYDGKNTYLKITERSSPNFISNIQLI